MGSKKKKKKKKKKRSFFDVDFQKWGSFSVQKLYFKPKFANFMLKLGAGIFFGKRGSQIYKKSASIKLRPPISATKFLWPPITDTPSLLNRQKLYWNQSFWTYFAWWSHVRVKLWVANAIPEGLYFRIFNFEQNKHTICGHHVTPYILVINNFMTPYFSFPKFMTP